LKIKSPIPIPYVFYPLKPPYTYIADLFGIAFNTCPVKDPPTASNPTVAPNFSANLAKFTSKSLSFEFKICFAPIFSKISTYSYFLTTLITSTSFLEKNLFIILPN